MLLLIFIGRVIHTGGILVAQDSIQGLSPSDSSVAEILVVGSCFDSVLAQRGARLLGLHCGGEEVSLSVRVQV